MYIYLSIYHAYTHTAALVLKFPWHPQAHSPKPAANPKHMIEQRAVIKIAMPSLPI